MPDELSLKLQHYPMFGLTCKVRGTGPVRAEVFIDLGNSPTLLKGYRTVEYDGNSLSTVMPGRAFNSGEFSDNEMNLVEQVARIYKRSTAKTLVAITHR